MEVWWKFARHEARKFGRSLVWKFDGSLPAGELPNSTNFVEFVKTQIAEFGRNPSFSTIFFCRKILSIR